jgi:hypothetical protein
MCDVCEHGVSGASQLREQYDAELGVQMYSITIPLAREASERNRPRFSPLFVRKCPNLKGLPA